MGQFVGAIEGIADACRVLDFPVVSGNVSFYNETNGSAIQPTPAIGGVGLIDDLNRMARPAFAAAGEAVIVIGETCGNLGASLYVRELAGCQAGTPPPVDLAAERRNGDFVRALITSGRISACHDVSDGGLLVAVAEMALAGEVGARLSLPAGAPPAHAYLFGEDQARYVVTTAMDDAPGVLADARAAGVAAAMLGSTGGFDLTVGTDHTISLSDLRRAHETWLPAYMAEPSA